MFNLQYKSNHNSNDLFKKENYTYILNDILNLKSKNILIIVLLQKEKTKNFINLKKK